MGESESEETFQVERLLNKKISRGVKEDHFGKGTVLYEVQWEGHAETTWEPVANLEESLVVDFEG